MEFKGEMWKISTSYAIGVEFHTVPTSTRSLLEIVIKGFTLPVSDKHCSKARLLYSTFNLPNPKPETVTQKKTYKVSNSEKMPKGMRWLMSLLFFLQEFFKLKKA